MPYEWNWSQDVEKCTLDLVLSSSTRANTIQTTVLASKECQKFSPEPLSTGTAGSTGSTGASGSTGSTGSTGAALPALPAPPVLLNRPFTPPEFRRARGSHTYRVCPAQAEATRARGPIAYARGHGAVVFHTCIHTSFHTPVTPFSGAFEAKNLPMWGCGG